MFLILIWILYGTKLNVPTLLWFILSLFLSPICQNSHNDFHWICGTSSIDVCKIGILEWNKWNIVDDSNDDCPNIKVSNRTQIVDIWNSLELLVRGAVSMNITFCFVDYGEYDFYALPEEEKEEKEEREAEVAVKLWEMGEKWQHNSITKILLTKTLKNANKEQ